VDGRMPEIYFSPDLGGYGWCFRKGSYLNVGLGHLDARDLPRRCRTFLAFLRDGQRVPDALPGAWPGHAYRLFAAGRRAAAVPGVLLAGDAAGLAYAESGEGIRPAVESGLMAAEVIIRHGGQVPARAAAIYERGLARRYGRGLAGAAAAALLPGAVSRALAPLALGTPWLTRHLVFDRWFLHAHVPPLAGSPRPAAAASAPLVP
jgi:flavin-dependent dehydrogenase